MRYHQLVDVMLMVPTCTAEVLQVRSINLLLVGNAGLAMRGAIGPVRTLNEFFPPSVCTMNSTPQKFLRAQLLILSKCSNVGK